MQKAYKLHAFAILLLNNFCQPLSSSRKPRAKISILFIFLVLFFLSLINFTQKLSVYANIPHTK